MCLIFILALANFFWGQNGSEKCPIFIILTFYDFRTMFPKNLCDEVFKIKNPRCTFSSIFHADPQEIFFVWYFRPFLVENCPRKWAIFIFFIISCFLKSLNMFGKNLCDELSKIKNPKCTFFLFFHANPHEILFFCHFH